MGIENIFSQSLSFMFIFFLQYLWKNMFYVDVHFNIFFNGLCFLCPKNLCLFQAQENVSPMVFIFPEVYRLSFYV